MPSTQNKSFTGRAPQTAAAIPELPDFNADFAELPGAQATNAAMQRWWGLLKQRLVFNEGDDNSRFFTLTKTINGVTASITEIAEITTNVEEYLEARYTINVTSGPVVTGMTLYSASGPDTDISYISFQADRFLINTAAGNKQLFSASASAVKLGDLFTVDLTNRKVYVGGGTFGSPTTYWYVDDLGGGRMSLGAKFGWDGSTLSIDGSGTFSGTITASAGLIGGWTINSTTLSRNNAILDSAGQLILGTSNDVVYISATDATYRIWIGNATAGSAAFRVTKAGVMTATNGIFSGSITSSSGTIGGFTISATEISTTNVRLTSSTSTGLIVGNGTNHLAAIDVSTYPRFRLGYIPTLANIVVLGTDGAMGSLLLATNAGAIGFSAFGDGTLNCGVVSATSFSGSGASITTINASNISSGTLSNSRLPSAISVTSLAGSGSGITSIDAGNISSGTLTRPVQTSLFDITGTSTDINNNNLRVRVGGSNVIVLNKDLPGISINNIQVLSTRYGSTPTDVASLVAMAQHHGLCP